MLNILYTNLGGVGTYSYDKPAGRVSGWANNGNQVWVLVPGSSFETARKEIKEKSPRTKIIFLRFSNFEISSSIGIILSYFIRILFSPFLVFKHLPNFDFAYSNSPVLVDTIPVLWLKLFGRCKHWVLMMDSVIPPPQKRGGNFMVNFLTYSESLLVGKIANIFADLIFTVNPELEKEMIKRGIKKEKITLSQNGLFMDKINHVFNPKNKKYEAVYMGRISINKGVFDLIDVWKEIIKKRPRAKLAIMGKGVEDIVAKFNGEVEKNGLRENIEYLGFKPDPQKYEILKNSKVFLYLSKLNADESWGISLMEALACGLPAISYDLPIYKHIYKTESLIRVELDNISSIAKKLLELLENEEKIKTLSLEAVNFAKNFDWFKIATEDLKKIEKKVLLQHG